MVGGIDEVVDKAEKLSKDNKTSDKLKLKLYHQINDFKDGHKEVIIPSYEGEMGILKDHIPLITFLRPSHSNLNEKDKKFFVEDGTVEFSDNNLLILTSTAKELSKMNKSSIESLIQEAEAKMSDDQISDKEKYKLSYKVNTLKNINL